MPTISATVLTSVLLLTNTFAFSAHWVLLGADAQGHVWHIDTDSILRGGDTVTAWKRIEFAPPYPEIRKGAPLKRAFVLNEIDCQERRTDLKAIGLLDPENSIISVHGHSELTHHWPSSARVPMLEQAMALLCRPAAEIAAPPAGH